MTNLTNILNAPPVSRVRRNHGLEHATLNVLAGRFPGVMMGGHSDLRGFWILGELPTEAVEDAVTLALSRMQAGEQSLAIHANCGTNFVASGIIAGLAAWLGMFGSGNRLRDKLERLPLVISLASLALVFAQPLGPILQARVTTSGKPGSLRVVQVTPTTQGPFKAHHVLTEG
jgi:hypothetical protein